MNLEELTLIGMWERSRVRKSMNGRLVSRIRRLHSLQRDESYVIAPVHYCEQGRIGVVDRKSYRVGLTARNAK